MAYSRLWFSTTLVASTWLAFGLLRLGGFPFARQSAHVEVRTVPPGAEVMVDGVAVGMSDSFLSVAPSHLQINFKKRGYEEATVKIEVGAGKIALACVQLKPKPAQLNVRSDLQRAFRVFIGPGNPRRLDGPFPCSLEPGLYEVWGERDGILSARHTVRLKSSQLEEVDLSWSGEAAPPIEIQASPESR